MASRSCKPTNNWVSLVLTANCKVGDEIREPRGWMASKLIFILFKKKKPDKLVLNFNILLLILINFLSKLVWTNNGVVKVSKVQVLVTWI